MILRRNSHRVALVVLIAFATLLYFGYQRETALLPITATTRPSTEKTVVAPNQQKESVKQPDQQDEPGKPQKEPEKQQKQPEKQQKEPEKQKEEPKKEKEEEKPEKEPAKQEEKQQAVLSDNKLKGIKTSILEPPPPIPKLECPLLNTNRYQALKPDASATNITYFFAINLRENLPILPRLLGSLVEVLHFLGPKHCSVSIVEGNSPDGTAEVLEALGPDLRTLGATYHFSQSKINPKEGDRIEGLAALRNAALEPMFKDPRAGKDTTVVFLNDVTACAEDILELVHQKVVQGADMTCAVDWNHNGNPTFYDVWIARTLTGRQFFENPNGTWDHALDLFPNAEDKDSKEKWDARKPFQVFACWNGVAVFSAAPFFLADTKHTKGSVADVASSNKTGPLRFRAPREGECKLGEPTIFCKDLWWRGYGKIAVIPTVHFGYSDEGGRKIKELIGYASKLLEKEDKEYRIKWQDEPPENIWCSAPPWKDQHWVPWNETLA